MGYGFTALLSSQGSLAAVEQTLLLRALLSPAGHVAWTGLAVGAFLAAVLLHAAWDGSNSLVVHIVVGVLSIALLLVMVQRAHRLPHRADREAGSRGQSAKEEEVQ